MASQLSQLSTVSSIYSIPSEITVGQDQEFIDELAAVEHDYYLPKEDTNDISDDEWESNSSHDESDEEAQVEEGVVDQDEVWCRGCGADCDREEDKREKTVIESFKKNGCGCEKKCSSKLVFQDLLDYRQQYQEMSKEERDVAIKAALKTHRNTSRTVVHSKRPNAKKFNQRQRAHQDFYFQCAKVCQSTFIFIHGIGTKALKNVESSLDEHGMGARIHGNTNKTPHNTLPAETTQQIKTFIEQHAARNALPLPGRLPNFSNEKVLLLPSGQSHKEIFTLFCQVATEMNFRQVSFTSFFRVWKQQCPYITIMKPSTDLCFKCRKFLAELRQGGRLDDDAKESLLAEYTEHVKHAKDQRDHYRQQCLHSKETFSRLDRETPVTACSRDCTMHYSWDFAQQVHIPHHAQQVGPIYFKTPRKVNVFGVCCEGSAQQVFYLVDEAENSGKGANEVISLVHHYFETHGLGETKADIHFDNCAGQNKNNVVLWYGLWRVGTGRHLSLTYNTMVVGHTKFDPDWHFGVWKNKWRRSEAECLEDVVHTVRASSEKGHNIPQLCSDPVNPVSFFKWREFLCEVFKPLIGITKFHHFRMTSAEPGVVYCKQFENSVETRHDLLRPQKVLPDVVKMPSVSVVPGLSAERQWYLYQEIRPLCFSDDKCDKICPEPSIPRPPPSKKMKTE